MTPRHRKTFVKAYEEEIKHRRWKTMTDEKQAAVLAFCACVQLRMQGSSMDEVRRSSKRKTP